MRMRGTRGEMRRRDVGQERVAELEAPVEEQAHAPQGGGMRMRMRAHGGHILLAEDDGEFRAFLESRLRRAGYRVTTCTHGINLAGHLSGFRDKSGTPEHYDLVISDIRMPALSGLEVLQDMEPKGKMPPTILITAFGDEATHAKAEEAGAVACLDKPFDVERLLVEVRKVLG